MQGRGHTSKATRLLQSAEVKEARVLSSRGDCITDVFGKEQQSI